MSLQYKLCRRIGIYFYFFQTHNEEKYVQLDSHITHWYDNNFLETLYTFLDVKLYINIRDNIKSTYPFIYPIILYTMLFRWKN